MANISDQFLSGGKNPFNDLLKKNQFIELVKFGLKPEYLNSLPNAQALGDKYRKYILGKNKGGQVKTTEVKTTEVKSFKRGGQFKGTF